MLGQAHLSSGGKFVNPQPGRQTEVIRAEEKSREVRLA